MRGKVSKPRPRRSAAVREGRDSSSPTLSFADLEIPTRPLLNKEQEAHAGGLIQGALKRLSYVLPRHPRGYRRYLARMNGVVMGGGLMFSWLSLRERMAGDLKKATRALERSEKLAASDPKKAWKAFLSGVAVLETYPLDPETLFQWSREVAESTFPGVDDVSLAPGVKVERLLKKLVGRLRSARDELVLPNFRLVLKDVFRYYPVGMRRSDLFQEGVIGLQKAAFRYDPLRGTRFSTYATYWIRQAIRKSLIDKSRMIRVPQAVQEELRKETTKFELDEATRIRRLMTETMLLSSAEGDDGNERNAFVLADATRPELGEKLRLSTIPRVVSEAIERLDSRQREIVLRRFGLAGNQPQTLEEIGTQMNLSRERIRQIEREALARMSRSSRLQEIYEQLGIVAVGNSPSAN